MHAWRTRCSQFLKRKAVEKEDGGLGPRPHGMHRMAIFKWLFASNNMWVRESSPRLHESRHPQIESERVALAFGRRSNAGDQEYTDALVRQPQLPRTCAILVHNCVASSSSPWRCPRKPAPASSCPTRALSCSMSSQPARAMAGLYRCFRTAFRAVSLVRFSTQGRRTRPRIRARAFTWQVRKMPNP
jgi:hypothetical protein